MSDSRLLLTTDVDDKGSFKLEKFNKKLNDVSKSSSLTGTAFGDLRQKAEELGLPIGKLESYFGGFGKGALVGSVAVAGVGLALGAATLKSIEFGASLVDLRDQTGLSVEELSSFRNVAASSNTTVGGIADAITKLTVNLGKNGESFKKLGIDISDPIKAFDQIKTKIADTSDPIERARIGNEAFGKSFKDLMPLLTMANDEYSQMKGNTQIFSTEFAENAARVDDKIALLKNSFSDFGVAISTNFIPAMETLVDLFSEAAIYWSNFSKENENEKIAKDRESIHNRYKDLQAESDRGADLLGVKRTAVKIDGKTEFQAQMEYTKSLQAAREAKEKETKDAQERATLEAKAQEALEKETEAREQIAKNLKQQKEAYEKFLIDSGLKYQNGPSQVDFLRDTPEGQKLLEERSLRLEKTYDDAAKLNEGQPQQINYLSDSELENTKYRFNKDRGETSEQRNERLKETNRLLSEQVKLVDMIGNSFTSVTVGPLEDFYKSIGSQNKSLGDTFSDLFDGILDNFGNMLASMLAQLTAKAAIFGLLNIITGGGAGGPAFAMKALDNFSWFANGSDYVPRTGMYTVGERGPEDVILPRGARVIPNDRKENSSQTVINIYPTPGMNEQDIVNAIDRYNKRNKGR